MGESVVARKSFEFAVNVVMAVRKLRRMGVEQELLRQLLRSGTSVGANVSEAQHGQSKKDFYAKMSIALKEAQECAYWLRLLAATEDTLGERIAPVVEELKPSVEELIRLLVSITKTTREALEK